MSSNINQHQWQLTLIMCSMIITVCYSFRSCRFVSWSIIDEVGLATRRCWWIKKNAHASVVMILTRERINRPC